jgi:predicted ATPase/transcriptional regulator with XRE-family HTH domain
MDEHTASFGERLRQLRVQAGLSQAELAARAKLSPAAVTTLERGVRSSPHPRTVEALADALGASVAERAALRAAASATPRSRPTAVVPGQPSVLVARLPVWLTSFVGREAEVMAVRSLLDPAGSAVRLLTLLGPGGVGKTRLAVAAANALIPAYPDGVVFVDLAPLRDGRLVPAAIARGLDVREGGGRSARQLVAEYLRERHMLLVLDNFEHLLTATPLLAELLQGCPRLAMLVTTRIALRMQGERRFSVLPLTVPAVADDATQATIGASPAAQLFLERVNAVTAQFEVTHGTATAVAAVCRRLDGLPLAIELAAARAALLGPEALLRRLEQRLPLLTRGATDLPQRQRTLRSTLAWSDDLLGPATQVLFHRLAVFAGGWTLDAAEVICAGPGLNVADVLDHLGALVDSSLVRRLETSVAEPRFGMLETVREYALEELGHRGELERTRSAHASFYLRMAEPAVAAPTVAPYFEGQSPPLTDDALDRLEAELDNLQAALEWWLIDDHPAEGLRLAVALSPLWSRRGHNAVGRRWLEAMLELADRTSAAGPAHAAPARPRAEQAMGLMQAGSLASGQGDKEQARAYYRRGVAAWRALDDAPGLASALVYLGIGEWVAGDDEQATLLTEEALARSRAANLPDSIATSLRNLGLIARSQGQYARAEALFVEAAAQALAPSWLRGYSLARSLSCLGRVAALRHDFQRAATVLRQAFDVIRQSHTRGQALADCLDWQAAIEAQQGNFARAVRLFGAADTHWRTSGTHRYLPDDAAYERDLATVRSGMDDQAFAGGWAEGAALQPEQAIAYALREIDVEVAVVASRRTDR